ncbi:hypothetical protein [Pseudomonas sp.]|uniref:hypothetical protein n=1 Tax=Pseudomonas sp. TaxID=306 RepID=UPI00258D301A|nr:hypothetical protein [Pseudomonas sp.]
MSTEMQIDWSGEGRPPVGVVCEVEPHNTLWGLNTMLAVEMKIAGYHDELVWLIDRDGRSHWTRTDKAEFRPIRTAEQIAAEEREKAVAAMLELDPYLHDAPMGMLSRQDFCRKLYDAGCRLPKVEA